MGPEQCQRIAWAAVVDDTPEIKRPVSMDDMPIERSASSWQLMTHLELAALPTAVPCARMHAKAVALEWGLPALAEEIELIVSELVTNSVRAAERSREANLTVAVIRLWLLSDLRCILIRVWDGSGDMPVRKDAGLDEESGRGLMLVEHLSSEWGAYRVVDGKVVWALVLYTLFQRQVS
jgi:anti-sigma regulatory factor (Ser/Thr protein kinase)